MSANEGVEIVPFEERWADEAFPLWGSRMMATRGRLYDVAEQPGLVGLLAGQFAGAVNWVPAGPGEPWEVLAVYSAIENRGVASTLLHAVAERARAAAVPYLFLITTNDNTKALRFYQRLGWRLAALRPGAVDEARRTLKPEIPEIGNDEIPIRDEIELHLTL